MFLIHRRERVTGRLWQYSRRGTEAPPAGGLWGRGHTYGTPGGWQCVENLCLPGPDLNCTDPDFFDPHSSSGCSFQPVPGSPGVVSVHFPTPPVVSCSGALRCLLGVRVGSQTVRRMRMRAALQYEPALSLTALTSEQQDHPHYRVCSGEVLAE